MYCLSDQLSSSKIPVISFKFSSSISAALSQSDCCSMPESSGIRSASSIGIKSLSVQCTSNLPLLITHPFLSGDLVCPPCTRMDSKVHHVTCHPRRVSSFLQVERNYASEAGQADRRYRAVYELFNYFHKN